MPDRHDDADTLREDALESLRKQIRQTNRDFLLFFGCCLVAVVATNVFYIWLVLQWSEPTP
ncbi:hypothetical protein [uncultured Jannaschia sp.]|uniref:hypothetical protein n=1 Tax=uncultured Jannaschia sp. TaxID=293347 RepID=UPI002639D664|nr:hypothetical protein [uncultured Jannaschia sp.]